MVNNGKLYRTKDNSVLTGVCGGISEVYEIPDYVVRILCVVFVGCFSGIGLIIYIILANTLPYKNSDLNDEGIDKSKKEEESWSSKAKYNSSSTNYEQINYSELVREKNYESSTNDYEYIYNDKNGAYEKKKRKKGDYSVDEFYTYDTKIKEEDKL